MDFINLIDNIIEVHLSLSVENTPIIEKKHNFRYFSVIFPLKGSGTTIKMSPLLEFIFR
jgi:hypothetical protein